MRNLRSVGLAGLCVRAAGGGGVPGFNVSRKTGYKILKNDIGLEGLTASLAATLPARQSGCRSRSRP